MASASVTAELIDLDFEREDVPETPPRDDEGKLVCARVCEGGPDDKRCGYQVLIPWMSCPVHDLDETIVSPESE